LVKPINGLKEYAEYIEARNEVAEANKDDKLNKKKIELDEMFYELKQRFD
jgi:hypothetical protein